MRCLDGITDAMDMNLGKFWEMVRDREAWHAAVHGGVELDTTWRQNNNVHPLAFKERFTRLVKTCTE